MTGAIIGISSGLLIIFIFSILKRFDKTIIYGLILCGIGFLYVGFVWMDVKALVINSIQAILFVLIAYYGIKKRFFFLIAGYFLHGIWDFGYHLIQDSTLIPPQYNYFCFSIDFTMGFYLLFLKYKSRQLDINKAVTRSS